MSIQIIYKNILNLELWHDYYLGQPDPPKTPSGSYDISDVMSLVPTSDCLHVLKNLRWIFRPHGSGALVFASVRDATAGKFQTEMPIDQPYRLTFWLMVRDRYFSNFTNLPFKTAPNQIYYFSNLSNNVGHALFLTQPLPAYKAKTEYQVGHLVTRSNQTLEAVTYQASASSTPSASNWENLPKSQYVSALDCQPYQSPSRTQVIPNLNPGDNVRLALVDANQQETVLWKDTISQQHSPGSAIAVPLNFAGQQPGFYQLTLNGVQIDQFVLADPSATRTAFGLVEIVLNPTLLSTDFALLELQGQQTLIRPKTYVIRFKNRATYWRYCYEREHHFNQSNLPDFDLIDAKSYVTKRPRGLRFQPFLLKDGKDRPLPSADVNLIKPEIDNAQHVVKIFSDIYV